MSEYESPKAGCRRDTYLRNRFRFERIHLVSQSESTVAIVTPGVNSTMSRSIGRPSQTRSTYPFESSAMVCCWPLDICTISFPNSSLITTYRTDASVLTVRGGSRMDAHLDRSTHQTPSCSQS